MLVNQQQCHLTGGSKGYKMLDMFSTGIKERRLDFKLFLHWRSPNGRNVCKLNIYLLICLEFASFFYSYIYIYIYIYIVTTVCIFIGCCHDLLEDTHRWQVKSTITSADLFFHCPKSFSKPFEFYILYFIKQIDYISPCVCTVIYHRKPHCK